MLIIIDMQWEFIASRSRWLQKNIARQIYYAKRRREQILLVEYEGRGSTLTCIKSLIQTYPNKDIVIKKDVNGGEEIFSYITKKNIELRNIKIVGIETNCCVRSTVESLSNYLPNSNIYVLLHCSDDHYYNKSSDKWKPKRSNVKLVGELYSGENPNFDKLDSQMQRTLRKSTCSI